ncbi:NosD domain-containing protein [Methanosarcina acetivorans]|uniref:Cell surface protein n=1 Tax=Methanosarcina acetivorans (strain ATCC 35395 / DSM 2834 / JCM 12185 / C2A) TaxID=188937 RepID=Q8TQ14_METAC|nr:NosD domain-containing protein [Methanosarcina acetivorans]AAM05145.1 cell surface protein [Methanosarcina acetivorans C2A]
MWANKSTIFLVFAIFLMVASCSSASAREITVGNNGSGADFKSIQEAVNNSFSGDIILVCPGFYNESVDIGIQNISVLSKSENPEDTTVRTFKLSVNNITVKGFSIQENLVLQGCKGELWYAKIENCTVKNNILESGIWADECYNSIIEKNVILNSGIYISGPEADSNFTISDNLIVNGGIGVHHGSYNCVLLNNTLLNGSIGVTEGPGCEILGNYISNGMDNGYGILFSESSSNKVENNTIVNCTNGIFLVWLSGSNTIYNNTLTSNERGIYAGDSGGNSFLNNTISKNNIGILLSGSTIDQAGSNSLLNNTISNNNIGISLEGDSSSNLVTGNRIELNRQYGVYIKQVSYEPLPYNGTNWFYNNIFNNTINFFNDTGNYTGNYYTAKATNIKTGKNSIVLDTTKTSGTNIVGGPFLGGNYWAKPDGTGFSQNCNDRNKDGIGDSTYTASAYDVDYLPLVSISGQDQPVFPVADFSTNVTGGYVPLSVLFTDFSQNATFRTWDLDNDGITDSTDKTAVYVYPVSGAYTVNLTVNNANGTFSRLYPIVASDRPQYTLKEAQITTNKSNQTMPAIYRDKIVFFDDRTGRGRYNIYVYDLSTSRETQITTDNSHYNLNTVPAIYGDRIVWQEYRSTSSPSVLDRSDIHMYDLSTSKEIQITNSGKAFYPDIYGDRIVWTDTRNGNGDIYMYDLSASKETRITTNESHQDNPSIYGDRIVWQDSRNGKGSYNPTDIYMYNISTSTETRITTNNSNQYYPAVYGDNIVWKDNRNGKGEIYMYNLSTTKETQITINNGFLEDFAIYGDRMVWVDDRNRNADIYMYDLSTNAETQITTNKSEQSDPAIYGDRIVWTDWRNEYSVDVFPDIKNADIYMCTLSEADPSLKTPVADFFANITSGNAPLKVLFTDSSTGAPIYWFWDFGDGINSKHALNATHTFTEPGKYDVSLTVTNENGSNTRLIPEYIVVSEDERKGN